MSIPESLREKLGDAPLERSFTVERSTVNEEARTVTLAFASEDPVERYFGVEILECTPAAMRDSRLKSGANLLMEHQSDDVVGVVESATVGTDRVCRAVVRFGTSARAEEIYQDVLNGIRRNVSVGYRIHNAISEGNKNGDDIYRVIDWEPLEISIVAIPADATVGVGRSLDHTNPTSHLPIIESKAMSTEETKPVSTPAATPAVISVAEPVNHARSITGIAGTNPVLRDLAFKYIQEGKTTEEFQRAAIENLSSKGVPTADIGMNEKDVKRYSVIRALNALANPGDANAQRAAAFERECSEEVAKIQGKSARGIFVPNEVQKRDLLVGTPTAGGNMVETDLLSGSFIDILRNAMVIDRLGINVLDGLVGQVAIPKQTGGATAYWVAENGAPTESQQSFGQVAMSPKTVGAWTDISRRLLLQSSISIDNLVQTDLARVLGLAIQQAVINGAGPASNQPSGILTQITTPAVVGGANGANLTYANIIDMETAIAMANADVGTLGYLTNTKVRGRLKKTEKFPTTNGQPIWENGDSPLNGYKAAVTNAMPSNLIKGTSNNCSSIIFGNWADVVIGMWGSLDLMVDPYTGSTAGTVRIVALQDVDVALRNLESFATMVDALTP